MGNKAVAVTKAAVSPIAQSPAKPKGFWENVKTDSKELFHSIKRHPLKYLGGAAAILGILSLQDIIEQQAFREKVQKEIERNKDEKK